MSNGTEGFHKNWRIKQGPIYERPATTFFEMDIAFRILAAETTVAPNNKGSSQGVAWPKTADRRGRCPTPLPSP